jgi:hypothetical protein
MSHHGVLRRAAYCDIDLTIPQALSSTGSAQTGMDPRV